MGLLIFCIGVLIVVGIVCAIAYQIPWPPALAWCRWAVPCAALLIALVLIVQRMAGLPPV
jgi:hypothetical protein